MPDPAGNHGEQRTTTGSRTAPHPSGEHASESPVRPTSLLKRVSQVQRLPESREAYGPRSLAPWQLPLKAALPTYAAACRTALAGRLGSAGPIAWSARGSYGAWRPARRPQTAV